MGWISLLSLCLMTVYCLPIDDQNSADSRISDGNLYSSAPDVYTILNIQALQIKYLSDRVEKQEKLISQLTDKPRNVYAREVYTRGGAYADLTQAGGACNATMRDCLDLYLNGCRYDGVYMIDPSLNGDVVRAYCDMTNGGGGWTIMQRRVGNDVDFLRNREQYINGFGDLLKSHWLGLKHIRSLTASDNDESTEMYIYLEDFESQSRYAKYSNFSIADNTDNYRLYVTGYYGTAGDSLSNNNNCTFSTYDYDDDKYTSSNCALKYSGGWWFNACFHSHLNGLYLRGKTGKSLALGVNWSHWKGSYYSLKTVVMKIRRHVTHSAV